jgi:hypothetical protein
MSEESDKRIKEFELPKSLASMLGNQSAQITFDNMTKLCNQNEYVVNGVTFKRKILKPKELVKLFKLQNEMDKLEDPEKRMENVHQQAVICLEGVTPEVWDNTDAVHMEIVVGACLLISKGFRQI